LAIPCAKSPKKRKLSVETQNISPAVQISEDEKMKKFNQLKELLGEAYKDLDPQESLLSFIDNRLVKCRIQEFEQKAAELLEKLDENILRLFSKR
jgi:Fe-S-cluster formation regulator IscX/YfhJ